MRLRHLAPLLVLVLAAGGVWLARDLPRRKVEGAIAGRLDARVRLGRIRVRGPHDFLLSDLEVTRMGGQPRLDRLRVRTLAVKGSVSDILEGRFETLRLSSAEVRLVPP